MKPTQLSPIK